MMSRGYEVMAVSYFLCLRQDGERRPGRSEGDVAISCLCQQDRLFTVAANELEL